MKMDWDDLYKQPRIEHKALKTVVNSDLYPNEVAEAIMKAVNEEYNLHRERLFKEGEFNVMKRVPRYATFFDNDGHPIDDYVMGIYEVDECFEPSTLRIEGHKLDPARVRNGGYIRRALFKLNAPTINRLPLIWKVIFNDPATIVMWADGTKTVVKCQDGDIFDPEKGLAMAMCKKILGNKSNFNNEFKKWLPEEEK